MKYAITIYKYLIEEQEDAIINTPNNVNVNRNVNCFINDRI